MADDLSREDEKQRRKKMLMSFHITEKTGGGVEADEPRSVHGQKPSRSVQSRLRLYLTCIGNALEFFFSFSSEAPPPAATVPSSSRADEPAAVAMESTPGGTTTTTILRRKDLHIGLKGANLHLRYGKILRQYMTVKLWLKLGAYTAISYSRKGLAYIIRSFMDLEINLEELTRITDNFSVEKIVGWGGYGEVYKEAVHEVLSRIKEGYAEKSDAKEHIERMEMAHIKLEAALETSKKWNVTSAPLLRWRSKLKRATQECNHTLRCSGNDDKLRGSTVLRRFERFADGATEFLRYVELGGTPCRYMFSVPLIRHLLAGKGTKYCFVRGGQHLSLILQPFSLPNNGMGWGGELGILT
ncbi:unnamed protein product [Miscanthus lutarioriparius]|uniref:Uncharacterized protein n=1 Tax=Miscanthus lutarioriparius TaxID=422564 RepID=A0A811Q2R3_9POAL|nr:unnamed protein product [Miscanthus lutarioriparius]